MNGCNDRRGVAVMAVVVLVLLLLAAGLFYLTYTASHPKVYTATFVKEVTPWTYM